MRVVALYDIHGNLPALEAVLDEVDSSGADVIVIGGDVAGGPLPVETVEALHARCGRIAWVRGNGDREPASLTTDPAEPGAWAAGQLSEDQRRFLAGLPTTI